MTIISHQDMGFKDGGFNTMWELGGDTRIITSYCSDNPKADERLEADKQMLRQHGVTEKDYQDYIRRLTTYRRCSDAIDKSETRV